MSNCQVCNDPIKGDETFVPVKVGDLTKGGIHVRCLGSEPQKPEESRDIRVGGGWGPLVAVGNIHILGDDIQVIPTTQHWLDRPDPITPLRLTIEEWEALPVGHVVSFITPYGEGGRVYEAFTCPLCHRVNKTRQPPLRVREGLPHKIHCLHCATSLWHQGDSEPYNGGGTGLMRACYATLEFV